MSNNATPKVVAKTEEHENHQQADGAENGEKTKEGGEQNSEQTETKNPEGEPGSEKKEAPAKKTGKNGNRRQLDVEFPACSGNDVPAIRIAFRPEKVASGYSYLAFWIRSNTSAVVETSLPCGKWEGSYNGELTLIGDGKWHKYRLRFNEDFRLWKKCSQKNLRGELFLFSRSTRAPGAERSSMRFSIREITLE